STLMNFGGISLAAVAGTITYYVFGAIGGSFFSNVYRPYEGVFRPRAAILGFLPFGVAGTLVAMFIAAAIYAWGYRRGRILSGLQFGFLMGLFVIFGCVVHEYVITNVGLTVEAVEAVGELVGWTLAGAAIGLIYRPLQKTT
ncbi:MAG TPA: hypothetical protein VN936_03565, partial [Candidatus Acidoferrum sp.]|nr:hypothetical protein [Candidatus Acidoferrum sp.]